MTGFLFEKAVLEFCQYFPEEKQKKPFFFHSIRVGVFLYNLGYSEEIQIAGLFHDILEDTKIPPEILEKNFGKNILEIVVANSKNHNLPKDEILENIVQKCANHSLDAMIVKTADVYDNFLFYKKENNLAEIERCKKIANLILQYKGNYEDKIFDFLNEILDF